jgi:HEXXH motif-containing protein
MTHRLPEALLRRLARSDCPPAAADLITAGQRSKRLLLLRALITAADTARHTTTVRRRALDTHWALLAAADRADPVAAGTVLDYPLVGAWTARTIRHLHAGHPDPGRHLDHFAAVAVAAAVRAGVPFRLRLPLRGGLLVLPTLGAVIHPAATHALVTGGPRGAAVRLPGRPAVPLRPELRPGWRPLDTLPAVHPEAAPVPLDDLDPYRCPEEKAAELRPTGRLDGAERQRWRTQWRRATTALRRVDPQRAAETGALLRCVVPLAAPRTGLAGATDQDAFGAVLSSRPGSAVQLAAALVHEIQHSKLAAVMDLVPLHSAGPEERHWAPWRPDPRPLDALLQGLYAHLALADFWGRAAVIAAHGTDRETAWAEHARCWAQVGAALPGLQRAPELTPAGRLFAAELARGHARLPRHPRSLPHRARAAAEAQAARRVWIGRRMGTALR